MSTNTYKIFNMISENEASDVFLFNKDFENKKISSIKDLTSNVFNKNDMQFINKNTNIFTINENIYLHDSINTVQEKLMKNSTINNNIPISSMYMYGLSKLKKLHTSSVNFCCENLEYVSIGIYNDDENFETFFNNPYKNVNKTKYSVYGDYNKKVSSYNLDNNNIFLIVYDNIFDQEYAIYNYFPKLYEIGIVDKNSYLKDKNTLINDNSKYLNDTTKTSWKIIDYFDSFLKKNKSITDKINIFNKIKSLTFIKKQHNNIFLPIEILFRKLQTTKEVPLLKLNIGTKSINQYRLYGSHKNKSNDVIPDISINFLNKVYTELYDSKYRSLSCLIIQKYRNKNVYIIINLLENGDYILYFQPLKLLDINNYDFNIDTIELLCKNCINIFFDSIHSIVLDLPVNLFKINSLYDNDLIVKQVKCNYVHNFKDLKAVEYNLNKILKLTGFIFKANKINNISFIDLDYVYSTSHIFGYPNILLERQSNRTKSYNVNITNIQNIDDIQILTSFLECLLYILEDPKNFYSNFSEFGDINWDNMYVPQDKYGDRLKNLFENNENDEKSETTNKQVTMENILGKMKSTIKSTDKSILPKKSDMKQDKLTDIQEEELDKESRPNTQEQEETPEPSAKEQEETPEPSSQEQEETPEPSAQEQEEETSEPSAQEQEQEQEQGTSSAQEQEQETSEPSAQEQEQEQETSSAQEQVEKTLQSTPQEEEEENNNELMLNFDSDESSANTNSSDFLGGATKETLRDYLQNRIRVKDPLLVERSEKLYEAPYSRTCPTVNKRQPIILTDEEKENIDKFHPGSYGKSLTYNTDGSNKLHYICPRYWCVDENISLNVNDVNKDGAKITSKYCKDSKGNDGSILEFDHNKNHYDKNGNYVYGTPAVGDKSCIPCCFKKSTTVNKINPNCIKRDISDTIQPINKNRTEKKEEPKDDEEPRDQGEGEEGEEPIETKEQSQKAKEIKQISLDKLSEKIKINFKNEKTYNYIQQANKFPLKLNNWGYLPIQVEKILKIQNKNCDNNYCLLRYGVEINNKQSFLSTIASIYNLTTLIHSENNNKKDLSIETFKKYLLESLSIDLFYTLNNGNLVDIFYSKKIKKIIYKKYDTTNIYKKLYGKSNNKILDIIINSYENFIDYIKSDKYIDYTYLWDLLSLPNDKLFKNGLNIIILEIIGTEDMTNVKIICPTHYYSKIKFNEKHNICIIIKYGDYYEPLYRHYDTPSESSIIPIFNYDDIELSNFFINVKEIYENKELCLPFSTFENDKIYKNYTGNKIINILKNYSMKILTQVIDIYGKVNGIVVELSNDNIQYIPCFSSNVVSDYDIILSSDFIFNDYKTTIKNLKYINDKTNKQLKCDPSKKVIEIIKKKDYIVGILTELDLFIPIKDIISNIEDEMISEKNKYLYIDNKLKINYSNNNENIVKSVNNKGLFELENLFYNRFKILIREKLNKNKILQDRIFDLIKSLDLNYSEKQKQIYLELNDIIDSSIMFTDENEIVLCLKKANLIENKKNDCFIKNKKHLLPKTNLITKKHNKILYLVKLIDEMIRTQQGLYFFEVPNKYFSYINNYNYETHPSEIIVSQNELSEVYLEKERTSKYFFNENTSFNINNKFIKDDDKSYKIKLNKTRKNVNNINKVVIEDKKKKKRIRCPKGTRRNKKTGACEPVK